VAEKLLIPFQYYGSKARMLKYIYAHFPPHAAYDNFIDVFGGSGIVVLNKKPSKLDVFNDINGDIGNFFHVLREHEDELIRRLKFTPYSRNEFARARILEKSTSDRIERARLWFVVSSMRFSGAKQGGWSYIRERSQMWGMSGVDRFKRNVDGLYAIAERMRCIQVEAMDGIAVLRTYDTTRTVFYLDPPYHPDVAKDGYYGHTMSARDHEYMVTRLAALQGHVILSGYDVSAYNRLLKCGFRRYDYSVQASAARAARFGRVECIWVRGRR
jgi:DNA adenine methylase